MIQRFAAGKHTATQATGSPNNVGTNAVGQTGLRC